MGTLACGLGCFPLDNGAYPPLSHSQGPSRGIRGLVGFGRLTPPSPSSALPPPDYLEAVPKYISGRTSYLRVRLAFHPYPQLIPAFCTRHGFGPPSRYHRDFNLAMGSSPGFGSNPNNTLGLMETLFQVCSQFSSIRKLCPKTQFNDRLEWEFGPSTSSPPS